MAEPFPKPPPAPTPVCIIAGQPLNDCARERYAEKVLGHLNLPGEWAGWKLRGRWLISPEGDRINPQRLRGILFREDGEKRVRQAQQANAAHTALVVPWAGNSGLQGEGCALQEEA